MYNNIGDRIYCITVKRTGVENDVLFNDRIFTLKDVKETITQLEGLGFQGLKQVTLAYAINNKLLKL